MYARSSLILVLLAIGLGGLVWAQSRYPLVRPTPVEPVHSTLAELDEDASWAAITRNAPPPLADLTETVERPLFSSTRRVEAEPVAAEEVPDVAPTVSVTPPVLSLTAVVIDGDDRVAVVSQSGSGLFERLREGDQVQGWRVQRIDPDGLRLMLGESVHELDLRRYEASQAQAAPGLRRPASALPAPTSTDRTRPRRPARSPRARSRERLKKQ